MSSKKSRKKHGKKQHFKAESATASRTVVEAPTPDTAPLAPASVVIPPARLVEVPGLGLIRHDVRRVLVLAGSFVALELILWYLFGHTGIGPAIYKLIKL